MNNVLYCGTADVIGVLGGTASIMSIGVTGTDAMSPAVMGTKILRASNDIDLALMSLYGTNGFGTSASGTRDVPEAIKYIAADLSGAYVLEDLTVGQSPAASAWAKMLRERSEPKLAQFAAGGLFLPGYNPLSPLSNLPTSTMMEVAVRGELLTLTGTEWSNLRYHRIVPGSEVVYGTTEGTWTPYTRNTDYQILYYNQGTVGGGAGQLRRLGTVIPSGAEVYVDYKAIPDHVMHTPQDWKVQDAETTRRMYPASSVWASGS